MENFINNVYKQFYQTLIEQDRYRFILEGLGKTLIIAFFAVILGVILGGLVALIRNYHEETKKAKLANFISKLYVTIIRGTPAVLQLMIIYYVIFRTVDINTILVGVIAFGINSGAYVSEIIRAGINSIDRGQKEAADSLGLTYRETMKSIILPQAIRNVLPALSNEFITLLKETSVAGYIGIIELVKAADIIASGTYNYFFPLIIIAIIYLILTIGLSKLLTIFEKKVLSHARG
ncbi:MAG: amino acid ABC transporter permease [Tenericutes bacterium]|nr:amino acid ABC transporter permease [Mycoplasmatota bacterium]MDD6941872.1 amino acid ABC transporter permease [bacterium]MDY2696857.1 amino acid ABC transporter permease [Bacilli bacterium]